MSAIKLRFYCNTHGYVPHGFHDPIETVYFNQRDELGLPCPLCYKSRPMIIERWTGSTDSRGVEIYEGDIVDCSHVDNPNPGPVKWSDIHHAWIIDYPRYRGDQRDRWEYMHGKEHCYTVAGTVHDKVEA